MDLSEDVLADHVSDMQARWTVGAGPQVMIDREDKYFFLV